MGLYRRITVILSIALLAISLPIQAAELQITMEYKPTAGQPLLSEFTNTTPSTGFCAQYASQCQPGDFSILIPGFEATKYFDALSADPQYNRLSSTFDSRKKKIVLTERNSGNTFEADFRWAFFGVRYNNDNPLLNIFSALDGSGRFPVGGCSGRIGIGYPPHEFNYAWGLPENVVTCYRKLNVTEPPFQGESTINNLSLGYTLTTANPLQMTAGTYEGEIRYTVGDGADIDLYASDYSDSEIIIRLTATIEHAFYLFISPDSERVQLSPPGGWPRYMNGGPVPDSLKKEVPFILTSSRPFKIKMACGYTEGTGCGLRNTNTSQQVPLEVSVTLPGFRTASGQSVSNHILDTQEEGLLIEVDNYIVNRRSSLTFQVKQAAVPTMVSQPGSTWQGNVTIIFDADF